MKIWTNISIGCTSPSHSYTHTHKHRHTGVRTFVNVNSFSFSALHKSPYLLVIGGILSKLWLSEYLFAYDLNLHMAGKCTFSSYDNTIWPKKYSFTFSRPSCVNCATHTHIHTHTRAHALGTRTLSHSRR